MSEIILRTMRGTGEPLQTPTDPLTFTSGLGQPNMMDDLVRAASAKGVRHEPVDYYAQIAPAGGTRTFQESYHDGWRKAELADGKGIPTIWAGYSLGALILGDLMAAGELANCVGMILFADPLRHHEQISNPGVSRSFYGCVGARRIPNNAPLWTYSAPDDPISALAAGNGFRLFAQLVTGAPQRWLPGFIDFGATLAAVERYLGKPGKASRHVIYGTEKMPQSNQTYTQSGAGAVTFLINNHEENNR